MLKVALISRRTVTLRSDWIAVQPRRWSSSGLNVVFFGTGVFSINILNCLVRLVDYQKINKLCVVTPQSKSSTKTPSILGNKVIPLCEELRIPYHVWTNISKPEDYKKLLSSYDIGVVAAFGHLIPGDLIRLFPYGIVNVHPSLLPRWRGASPVTCSILFDDKVTGVSLMKIMPKHFDIGPIYAQKSIACPKNATTLSLLNRLGDFGSLMIQEFFEDIETSMNRAAPQSNENVTYAHKITTDMFYVDWNHTMSRIDCHYRALHEISHLKTKLNGRVVKLIDMIDLDITKKLDLDSSLPAGRVVYVKSAASGSFLAIKCKDGYVGFRRLVLNKTLSAVDFNNGFLGKRDPVQFEEKLSFNRLRQITFVNYLQTNVMLIGTLLDLAKSIISRSN